MPALPGGRQVRVRVLHCLSTKGATVEKQSAAAFRTSSHTVAYEVLDWWKTESKTAAWERRYREINASYRAAGKLLNTHAEKPAGASALRGWQTSTFDSDDRPR